MTTCMKQRRFYEYKYELVSYRRDKGGTGGRGINGEKAKRWTT